MATQVDDHHPFKPGEDDEIAAAPQTPPTTTTTTTTTTNTNLNTNNPPQSSSSSQPQSTGPWHLTSPTSPVPITITLTHSPLSPTLALSSIRTPKAGALVLFAGTTRDTFQGRPVRDLHYTSYVSLALRTMLSVAESAREKHALEGVYIAHRLGTVPIGEESVIIAVAAPHRGAAWRAGEEVLEEVKARVEIWKREEFWDGEGAWRANRESGNDGRRAVVG